MEVVERDRERTAEADRRRRRIEAELGLDCLLTAEATAEERDLAELQLGRGPTAGVEPAVRRVVEALDGAWRDIDPSRAEDRARLGRWLEENASSAGIRLEVYLPSVGVRVRVRETGRQGRLTATYGLGLYDFHREWPVDGIGVPKDAIEVLVADGEPVPILAWLERQGMRVLCPRCGGFLDRRVDAGCPARLRREEDQ